MDLKTQKPALILAAVVAISILIISITGILSDDGGDPYSFTSVRGEEVQIYGGGGPYRYDALYKGVAIRGYDWANLLVSLPLLMLAIWLYRQGELRGKLLLAAVFYHFAWNYLLALMGNAFNALFVLWVALFSSSLYGLFFVLQGIDFSSLAEKVGAGFPRKSVAVYVLLAGLFLLFSYTAQVISANLQGTPPADLQIYTTLELAALELSFSIPLTIAGAILLWRKKAAGYLICTLFVVGASLTFASLSIAHSLLHFSFGWGESMDVIQPIAFAVISIGFSVAVFAQMGGTNLEVLPQK